MVQYQMTEGDNWRFQRHLWFKQRPHYGLMYVFFLLLGIVAYSIPYEQGLLPLRVATSVFVIFIPIVQVYSVKVQMRKLHLYGSYEVETTPDHFVANSPAGRSEIKWSAFTKMTKTAHYYFFWMGAARAVVLPRRAFKTKAEEREFMDAVPQRLTSPKRSVVKPILTWIAFGILAFLIFIGLLTYFLR
ncbi:YcxB family protein [Tumebacillus flagellatus]|uniref:YcxB-like C-terminal domain-containing protein n=1 Tax=Tumebacillus flagellatus TaxID=1157490 RepID=A0A074LV91_9BACL|nr:YcxB family protein [Tumebacillus flagellatus]KEO83898.1 hypothetical protein EL26_06840 [Tumebacillus flagellatus]